MEDEEEEEGRKEERQGRYGRERQTQLGKGENRKNRQTVSVRRVISS
jgi:hypothetical protein